MNWNRIFSVLISGIYLSLGYSHGGAESAFKTGMFLILPLACIWFADAMGGYTGPAGNIAITKQSPGIFICILGWALLLLPLIFAIL